VGAATRHGDVRVVDVIHDGDRIATLDLEPLPDYCPHCSVGTVPFWGATAWSLS